jgi:phage major head subunit gpT-like protein
MIINQASLAAMYNGFKTLFVEAFNNAQPMYPKIAMEIPSSVREETYAWLGAFPSMREWIGDRIIRNLALHSYSIKNKDWESTIEVDRNDIMDDQIGVFKPIMQQMGLSAALHPDELIFTVLASGFDTTCYDGQYFFDDDHPVGDSTVSNFATGAKTPWYLLDVSKAIRPLIFQSRMAVEFVAKDDPKDDNVFMKKKYVYGVDRRDNAGFGLWQLAYGAKVDLDADNYAAARAAMMGFKDAEGKPLYITPNLLVVPPTLEGSARTLVLKERDAAGADNPWYKTADVLVVPWLS